jgi:hypothetical protein
MKCALTETTKNPVGKGIEKNAMTGGFAERVNREDDKGHRQFDLT